MHKQIRTVRAYAAAKLNLTLDILGHREDGYHLLDMVMQTVSIYDTLLVTAEEDGGILTVCDSAGVPCDESNTVHKAVRAFFDYIKIPGESVRIHIAKRIPAQAGLAGGSADAAAVLRALNGMYGAGLTTEQLCEIGLSVGADVPFCIRGGTMRAEGIGELLTPAPKMPTCFFVVCKPPVGVDTAGAYALSDGGVFVPHRRTPEMLRVLEAGELGGVCAALGNDFEDILQLRQVSELKERLLALGALGACMTGSGSAVYGVFARRIEAEACRAALIPQYRHVFVCEPVGSE